MSGAIQRGLRACQRVLKAAQRGLWAYQRGLKACQWGLKTCQRGLRACQRSLRAFQMGLRACKRDLRACQMGLRACQRDLRASQEAQGGWMDQHTDGRTDGWTFSPFYRTLSPVGAAAQKALHRTKIHDVLLAFTLDMIKKI